MAMSCQFIRDSNYYRLTLSHVVFEIIYQGYVEKGCPVNKDFKNGGIIITISDIEDCFEDLFEEVDEKEVNEIAWEATKHKLTDKPFISKMVMKMDICFIDYLKKLLLNARVGVTPFGSYLRSIYINYKMKK